MLPCTDIADGHIMGFDTIRFDTAQPSLGIQALEEFQTKSLGQIFNVYNITSDGRLVENLVCYESPEKSVAVAHRDLDYHGDLLLCSKAFDQLMVRFTHGKLEWIRKIEHPTPTDCGVTEDNITLSEEQKAELNRRIEQMNSGHTEASPWEEVRDRIVENLRKFREHRS